jgi:hypothetical protein
MTAVYVFCSSQTINGYTSRELSEPHPARLKTASSNEPSLG